MSSLRIPVEFDVADMPEPKELLDKLSKDQERRFLAVPARKLTTYDRALEKARNMVERNGMTVRVMEVRETIYCLTKNAKERHCADG
ncbi:hypothetical protein AB4037_08700 [Labrys sp. KB_33_2]|uniref:hypothetical protein n=1 Tax=Labrys sp. KB_33_2 TaxID=3237479 RepID=UPI003F93495F